MVNTLLKNKTHRQTTIMFTTMDMLHCLISITPQEDLALRYRLSKSTTWVSVLTARRHFKIYLSITCLQWIRCTHTTWFLPCILMQRSLLEKLLFKEKYFTPWNEGLSLAANTRLQSTWIIPQPMVQIEIFLEWMRKTQRELLTAQDFSTWATAFTGKTLM